jgi:ABC-type branched-subunit amino acid transport system substrate-binding protein/outer membrane protein assembly factor BamD (BamD/ComL family)
MMSRNLFLSPILVLAVLTLLVSQSAPAQSLPGDSLVFYPEVERVFVSAMRAFQAAEYDTAAVQFERCLRDFPVNHRVTGAYIMGAKALYHLSRFRESVRMLKNLIDLYPSSSYVDDAHYNLGLNYYRMGRYEDAGEEFLHARQIESDTLVVSRSEQMLDVLAADHLSAGQIQILSGDATNDDVKALLALRLADKVFRKGDARAAEQILEPIVALPASTRYVSDALDLLERIRKGGVFKVGVVLPLMLQASDASARNVGVEMLNGMKAAVEEYNERSFPKVSLEPKDSERDPSLAARAVTELCTDPRVMAILGPAFSDETFTAAGIANALGVPMITPTATADGISAIGPFVFQLNPDYEVRGRLTARYAYDKLGARRFALMAPIGGTEASKQMSDAFLAEVDTLGAALVDQEWYQAGSTDLRYQFMTMRERALAKTEDVFFNFARRFTYEDLKKMLTLGADAHVLDSLVEREASVPVEMLLGPTARSLADSFKLPVERRPVKYDSLGISVDSIDAMFFPIASSDEIGIVASQLRYFNFRTQVLGTGDWNDLSELEENRRYTDGIIFAHDTYVNERSEAYRYMVARYQKMFGQPPSVNALFGYDAAQLLLNVIAGGATQRPEIAAALAKTGRVDGLHTSFVLLPNRVNSYMTIMRYRNRTIGKIDEFDLGPKVPSPPGNP